MYAVGIDMVEISRIKRSAQNDKFLKFILGEKEYAQLKEKKFPPQSIAANFCAKEAFSKALGTGIKGFKIKDVQILRDAFGKPYIYLENEAFKIAKEKNLDFSVSLTHTKEYASAVVIAFKKL